VTIGRVTGCVVATQKDPRFVGAKLLMVQPQSPEGAARGEPIMAIDMLDAGEGDTVLIVQEGRAAQLLLGIDFSPVDCAVVGIVDRVDLFDRP